MRCETTCELMDGKEVALRMDWEAKDGVSHRVHQPSRHLPRAMEASVNGVQVSEEAPSAGPMPSPKKHEAGHLSEISMDPQILHLLNALREGSVPWKRLTDQQVTVLCELPPDAFSCFDAAAEAVRGRLLEEATSRNLHLSTHPGIVLPADRIEWDDTKVRNTVSALWGMAQQSAPAATATTVLGFMPLEARNPLRKYAMTTQEIEDVLQVSEDDADDVLHEFIFQSYT